MSPDDLCVVQRSWAELRRRRPALRESLAGRFAAAVATPAAAAERAGWLVAAVDGLVGLLAAPSSLAAHARELGATWPDPLVAPSFAVDGRAWMAAAAECQPSWTPRTEAAWRQAWLLLSDELAAEALSPFADEPPAAAVR